MENMKLSKAYIKGSVNAKEQTDIGSSRQLIDNLNECNKTLYTNSILINICICTVYQYL